MSELKCVHYRRGCDERRCNGRGGIYSPELGKDMSCLGYIPLSEERRMIEMGILLKEIDYKERLSNQERTDIMLEGMGFK